MQIWLVPDLIPGGCYDFVPTWPDHVTTLFLLLQQGFLTVSPDRQHLPRLIIFWNLVATTQDSLLLPTEVDVRRSTSVVMFSKEVCKFLLNTRQCRMGPVVYSVHCLVQHLQNWARRSPCRFNLPPSILCERLDRRHRTMFMVDLRSLVSIWFPEPSNKGHLRLWHAGGQGD